MFYFHESFPVLPQQKLRVGNFCEIIDHFFLSLFFGTANFTKFLGFFSRKFQICTLLFLFLFSVKSIYKYFLYFFCKAKIIFFSHFSCIVWKSRQKYCHDFTEKSKFFSQTNLRNYNIAVSAINFMNFLWIQGFFVPFVGIFREFNDFFFFIFFIFFGAANFSHLF